MVRGAPPPVGNAADDQREVRRTKVFSPAQLVVDGVSLRAHVLNVSARGARVHTAEAQQVGRPADLYLSAEPYRARVIWVQGVHAGLRFEPELTADQVRRISGRERY
ncbi:PilZ domain-containing protein [Sphingomonas sp. XXL09]|uniref:PilZ domain-containing protein n=1 Tax=Sphingomonas sp. XXL09 TaxID=3457787 RepID=UPI00406BAF5F